VNCQGLRVTPLDHSDLAPVAAVEQTLADSWSRHGLEAELAQPAGWQLVVRTTDGGAVLAYVFGRTVTDEGEILRLAVLPTARRRGVGSFLLRYLLDLLGRQGVRVCHLEVRAGNHGAIRLYEKMGFKVSGRRRAYYAVPPEDAVLMTKQPRQGEQA